MMNQNNNTLIWENTIEILIFGIIIIIPLFFYPYCKTVFIPPKTMIYELLIIVGLMFWGFKLVDQKKLKFLYSPLDPPIVSFILIIVLSLIWSENIFVSFNELLLFLAGPFFYFLLTNNIRTDKQINRIVWLMVGIGICFGVYGIFQYIGIDFSYWAGNVGRQKVFGLFGNVNYFAEYLIIPLSVSISLFFITKNKLIKTILLIGILTMGGSLLFTFTRGSYLGFAISLIIILFLFMNNRKKEFILENRKIFIFSLVLVIIVGCLFIVPNPLNKQGTAIYTVKNRLSLSVITTGSSALRRIAIWKFTALMIKDHPLIGSGIGTFRYNTLKYHRSLYPYGFADMAHNEYLQLWAELGLVGLATFIWVIITYFIFSFKILKTLKDNKYQQGIVIGLMGGITAILVDSLFGFPLHLPASISLFWLMLALTSIIGNTGKANAVIKQDKIDKDSKKNKVKKTEQNESYFSYLNQQKSKIFFKLGLYICIILITVFLGVTVFRPFMARVYRYYGLKEVENKNWDEAIKVSEQALKWNPYFGEAYYDIGMILKIKDFNGLAIDYFEKASKYVDLPELPQNFASVYMKAGKIEKAIPKLRQAIKYQADVKSMVPYYSELGNAYIKIGEWEQAELAFKKALSIDYEFVNAHYGLAGVYTKRGNEELATHELEKVIELSPDSTEAKMANILLKKIQ